MENFNNNQYLELMNLTCSNKLVDVGLDGNCQYALGLSQMVADVRKNYAISELKGRCDYLPSITHADENEVHPPMFGSLH